MEVAVNPTLPLALVAWLGKEAAASTVSSKTVKVNTPEGKDAAAVALKAGPKPAAHVAPTRYGRKPYSRGMERDST